jgi:ADP-heptose:LPS heptosyltransferase
VQIVTFSHPVQIQNAKTAGTDVFRGDAQVPYIFSLYQMELINRKEAEGKKMVVLNSMLAPRLPPFVVRPTGGRGESVLFHTGAGGYGDQIMAWPAAKLLHDMGYAVHILSEPGNNHLWTWFPWVHSVKVLPIPASELLEFDHLAIYPYVTNVDEHPGQPHPTDHLLRLMGVIPETVPVERKRVCPPLSMRQQALALAYPHPLGVIQLAGSNLLRRPAPARVASLLRSLLDAIPEMTWVVLHDDNGEHMQAARTVQDPRLKIGVNLPFDELVGLVSAADIAVGPDSFLAHLRGALGLPGIVIFGTHEPALRTHYYPDIVPIWERNACSSSPCLAFRREFPVFLCPPSQGPRTECAVLAAGYDKLVASVVDLWKKLQP